MNSATPLATPLATYLASKKLERAAFANLIGISPSMASHIANGTRSPSVELAKKIERRTNGGVSALSLLGLLPPSVKAKRKVARK